MKSWVKDSGHCIEILSKIIALKPGSLILSLDVVYLYLNMDKNKCISCVRIFLIERHHPSERPSVELLIELFDYVLKFNNFQFDWKNYLQVGSTALDTTVALSLVSVFMSEFEEKYIYTYDPDSDIFIKFLDNWLLGWRYGRDKSS